MGCIERLFASLLQIFWLVQQKRKLHASTLSTHDWTCGALDKFTDLQITRRIHPDSQQKSGIVPIVACSVHFYEMYQFTHCSFFSEIQET
jgi:hypothetical protein